MITNKLELLNFGKYYNKTIHWVIKNDPKYLLWCYQNIETCNYSDQILLEAIKNSKNKNK